eukprot:TRINITY_DN5666_c0_g1_i1.p1 TRINITY_DN5666_c0_g1~~TRINITY_DN5666_c0_g1_i1.p1  ORF type:complete len:326 (+),score=75.48 TRINITY_DN5666_c0_g1_i1:25-978(+)
MTLPNLFYKARALYLQAENGESEKFREAAVYCAQCVLRVAKAGLFSQNEELEDIKTSSLKYLLCPFYLGMSTYNTRGSPIERPMNLKRANAYLNTFLMKVEKYKIIHPDDASAFNREAPLNRIEQRDELRNQHRRKKALEEKLLLIEKRNGIDTTKVTEDESTSSWEEWDEEDERQYYLSLLQLCALQAIRDSQMIETEIPFAEKMAEEAEKNGGELPKPKPKPTDITKTFTSKRIEREEIKKGVFKPGWIQPTMSVEEAGYWEMQHMIKQNGGQSNTKKCSSSDEEEEEEDVYKAREWDEFKEANPRGSGNRYNQG